MAILVLFQKNSSSTNSHWNGELRRGAELALNNFCQQMPATPSKLLRQAFSIRGLSSAYISRVFVRTEMVLKSRNVIGGTRQLQRSRSSENLPTSQSQVNIQMMSHTLTIREVFVILIFELPFGWCVDFFLIDISFRFGFFLDISLESFLLVIFIRYFMGCRFV